jgi:hypothetical protein
VRRYEGGGRRGAWQGVVDERFQPFQRPDGSVMTQEEIGRVVQIEKADPKAFNHRERRQRQAIDADAVWEAVTRLGSQGAAIRELGISKGGLYSGLRRYMRDHNIDGPMPGQSSGRRADGHTPVEKIDYSAAKAAEERRLAQVRAARLVAEKAVPDSIQQVTMMSGPVSAEREQVVPGPAPASDQQVERSLPAATAVRVLESEYANRALDALVDLLRDIGPDWTQTEAERWFKAFMSTVDLAYPPKADA